MRSRLLLTALLSLLPTLAKAASDKPNIILILADDLGYGELGFQGFSKQVPTPHVDAIANNGVRFTQGYIAATYCSPSRAGLMTGRYPTRFGHEFNGGGPFFGLPLSEKTIADRLKPLGYATCAIGKWHLGDQPQYDPTKRGFDEYMGCLANPGSYYKPNKWVDSLHKVTPDKDFYTTEAFADRAVDWIERNKNNPFFLYLPFNAEHAPLQAPQKYMDRFKSVADPKRRSFCAVLSAMDDAIGRVMTKLRDVGAEQNTIVVFLSDNGGPTKGTTSSNGPLRGFKMTTNEGGTRVPFVMQWPGHIQPGKTYASPVINLDLLPTLVTAAGGTVDPAWKIDGVNILPFITGQNTAKPHETLFWRYGDQWAIVDGDWKMVVSKVDSLHPRLINLAADLAEANDVATAEPTKVAELTTKWKAWNKEQAKPLWNPGKGKVAEE